MTDKKEFEIDHVARDDLMPLRYQLHDLQMALIYVINHVDALLDPGENQWLRDAHAYRNDQVYSCSNISILEQKGLKTTKDLERFLSQHHTNKRKITALMKIDGIGKIGATNIVEFMKQWKSDHRDMP